MYKSDIKFLERAAELAENGEHRVRVGALAVSKGKPLAGAWNTIRNTSPVGFVDISVHAEVACIEMLSYQILPRTTLYVVRINKAGEIMPSEPCPRCLTFLEAANIRSIVYYDKDLNPTRY